jgi:hypothetical protein
MESSNQQQIKIGKYMYYEMVKPLPIMSGNLPGKLARVS